MIFLCASIWLVSLPQLKITGGELNAISFPGQFVWDNLAMCTEESEQPIPFPRAVWAPPCDQGKDIVVSSFQEAHVPRVQVQSRMRPFLGSCPSSDKAHHTLLNTYYHTDIEWYLFNMCGESLESWSWFSSLTLMQNIRITRHFKRQRECLVHVLMYSILQQMSFYLNIWSSV